ncbi:hypothetical protein ACFLTM_00450 [Candidatus Bipolaricaulota bacterium]
MRRGMLLFVLGCLVILLFACTNPWSGTEAPTGYARIRIAPRETTSQSVGPKEIPAIADSLRFRIWQPTTQYNDVLTVNLQTPGLTLAIEIPAGDDYVIDALSYQNIGYPVALTGDRATGVDIAADAVTNVTLSLQPWDVTITGPDEVAPEAEYTLFFAPEDGGGLLTDNTFDTVTLRASQNDFSNPADPLPAIAGQAIHSNPDGVNLTGEAPNVAVDTDLFIAALFQFTQDWFDWTLPNPAERSMFLELPNRHMGEALHQMVVRPSIGGVEIDVSGLK